MAHYVIKSFEYGVLLDQSAAICFSVRILYSLFVIQGYGSPPRLQSRSPI